MPRYRLDIQLLRGVAVLLVVAYHAFALPGGYLGVDVFFAISGFVITGSALREVGRTGRFDILSFFERRVCRLLPALAVMLVVTSVLALFILSPLGAGRTVGSTARAAAVNLANVELYGSIDYFAPAAERNPLLHTWSLSVEEQFYFGFAVVVFGITRVIQGDRLYSRLASVLLALGVVSLGLSIGLSYGDVETVADSTRLAFYSPLPRAFEFLIGASYAVLLHRRSFTSGLLGRFAPVLGVLLLLLAATLVGDTTTPAAAAALPMAAFLLFVRPSGSPRWLNSAGWLRPLAWLGDISYSWYLFHWPMLVLARAIDERLVLPAVLASVGVAAASRRLVEDRFREPVRRRRSLLLLAACVVVPFAIGTAVDSAMDSGLGIDAVAELDRRPEARQRGCHGDLDDPILTVDECLWPADNSNGLVMLVGDSHAVSLADAVVIAGNNAGFDVHVQTRSLCPFSRRRIKRRGCAGYQRDTISRINELQPDVVIIANRAPSYVLTEGLGQLYVVVDGEDEEPTDRPDALQAWEDGQRLAIEAIRESVGQIVIVETVPTYEESPVRESFSLLTPQGSALSQSRSEVDERRGATADIHAQIAQAVPEVSVIDPVSVLCEDACSQRVDGTWLYYDDDHVSFAGATAITTLLRPFLVGAG